MASQELEDEHSDVSADGIAVPLAAEEVFGRYRLCYELGAGGMATVYLARTEGPGGFTKAVALKRIHPHLVKRQTFVSMFLDEARIASLISHPNVCGAFDFGEVDGTFYIAMEYLTGEALSQVVHALARRPELLASDRWSMLATRIAADVCEGLHAAHELRDERGRPLRIVHRDVSPQNVFVTYDGAVKLVDFGVAFARDRLTETVAGTIKGKLAYLAPEQLVVGSEIDRRVDVWALGVTLWEMLAGRRLFARRSDAATLAAIQTEEVPPLSAVRADVPPELDDIVARALARDPEDRYPSARALGRDLSELVARAGHPVGLPQVAELMTELFPERRPKKLEALSEVMDPSAVRRRLTRSVGPAATVASGPPPAPSPPSPPEMHELETSPHVRQPPARTEIVTPPGGVANAPAGGRVALYAGGALAACGVVAIAASAWVALSHHDPPPPITAAPPVVLPAPAAPAPPTPSAPPPLLYLPTSPVAFPPPAPPSTPYSDTDVEGARPADVGEVAPHRPTAPRDGASGEARFVCDVWADVRERGHNLGRTPMVSRLRAGRHTVEFVGSDGVRRTRTFELDANGTAVVRCD